MAEILNQLRTLLLGSIPTIFLFLFLVICYRFLVYGPLTRVLAERRARTEGAVEQANAAAAAAAAKTQEYEAQLRAARAKIFHARQEKLDTLNKERDKAIAETQESAHKLVQQARATLEGQASAAQQSIEASIDELAGEILRVILPQGRASAGSVR